MRESRFRELMTEEFGAAYAGTVARTHSIRALDGTAEDLLAGGISPRLIWEAICEDFEIPLERQHGRQFLPKR